MNEPAAPAVPAGVVPVDHKTGVAARVIAIVLAVAAGCWHALLMTRATNDNFLHMTFAQELLAGELPVRDFFDQGWVLQYSLSALAQWLAGPRLAGEAAVVGLAWAVSTCVVFVLIHRLTRSTVIATTSALLLIVSSARGYSYPKGIVYAVAAALWWAYVRNPSTRRAVIFGAWAAVAFYWRPDHGIYVALGLTLATIAAHGVSLLAVKRCATAAAAMIVAIAPFLLYVQAVHGLQSYVRTGVTQAQVEHESHGTHEWPLLRYAGSLVTVESAAAYAPVIGIRWRADSTEASRNELLGRYELERVRSGDNNVERVRLSPYAIDHVRELIAEPLVDDTAGLDRAAARIPDSEWPTAQRWRFTYPWLRLRILPALDPSERAAEFTAALFLLLPLLLLATARPAARRLNTVSATQLAAFALFAFAVSWAMIRNPFTARVADAVVLNAVAFGLGAGALWSAGRNGGMVRYLLVRGATTAVAVGLLATVAIAGRFESPVSWPRSAMAAYDEFTAVPPLEHYVDRRARFTLRLAAYVRDCVPPDDRVVVLWFEPEIYYYSERLTALRLLVFSPAWAELQDEQRATLEKVSRYKPPLILARQSALDEYARAAYPAVIAYMADHYVRAATVQDGGEEYLIYARRDRPALRTFDSQPWPCFTATASRWERVGDEN